MTTLLTLAVSVLVFGAVIFVHEFGHYLAARHHGIQVNEFSIGMGPVLWQTEKHGTVYSVRLLPIGGFNALEGEDGEEDEQEQEDEQKQDGKAAQPTPAPEQTEAASAKSEQWPAVVEGRPFFEAPVTHRMWVIVSGALMNFLLGIAVLTLLVIVRDGPIVSRVVHSFHEGARSAQTGLQAEDKILAVNGHRCFVAADISYELQRTEGYSADFTVLRGGEKITLPGVQFDTRELPDGRTAMVVDFIVYGARKTPRNVMKEAFCEFLYYARVVVRALLDLAVGRVPVNDLSGPLGIVSAIGEAVRYGWQDVLELMALITVNLGVFNLLPLPALDGGRLVFLALEGIFRRPVPARIQTAVNVVGMAALLTLMLFVTYQDVLRIF